MSFPGYYGNQKFFIINLTYFYLGNIDMAYYWN